MTNPLFPYIKSMPIDADFEEVRLERLDLPPRINLNSPAAQNDSSDDEDDQTTQNASSEQEVKRPTRHRRKQSTHGHRRMRSKSQHGNGSRPNTLQRPQTPRVVEEREEEDLTSPPMQQPIRKQSLPQNHPTQPNMTPPRRELEIRVDPPSSDASPQMFPTVQSTSHSGHQLGPFVLSDEQSTVGSYVGTSRNPVTQMYQHMGTPPMGPSSIMSREMFQQPKFIYRAGGHLRRRKQRYTPPSDDENDDDALSVIEEAAQEESRQNIMHRRKQHMQSLTESSIWKFVLRWVWELVKALILAAVFLVPGVFCLKSPQYPACTIFFGVNFYYYALMAAIVIGGHFVASFAVKLAIFIIRRTPVLGTQFLYYIHNLSRPLKWAILTTIIQISFEAIVQTVKINNVDFATANPIVTRNVRSAIGCLIATSILFLIKALVLRLIAVSFHRGAYYRRIKNALFSEHVLNNLLPRGRRSKRGVAGFVSNVKSFVKKDNKNKFNWFQRFRRPQHEQVEILSELPITEKELLDKRPFSGHRFAAYTEFIKNDDFSFQKGVFREALLSAKRIEIRQLVGNAAAMDDAERLELLSHAQATRLLANLIYNQLRLPERSFVDLEDFTRILGEEIAPASFALFDGHWNAALTEKEVYTTLLSLSRERKALRTALNDAETAVGKLDAALTGFVVLMLLVLYFIIFGVDAQKVLTTLSSFLLASAFAIGSSAKALLESIVFIFVSHPYDIGDRVVIDKIVYTVTKVNLLTSELRRYDNSIMYFSNSVLSQKSILNLRRSPDQFDLITLQISFYTPTKALREFEQKLGEYLAKHTAHYYRKFEVEYKEIENSNRMVLRLWIQHRSNFQNTRRYRERRGKLLLRVKKICENLEIEYELPVQRVVHEGYGDEEEMTPELAEYVAPVASHFAAGSGGLGMTKPRDSSLMADSNTNNNVTGEMAESYKDQMFDDASPYGVVGGVIDRESMDQYNDAQEAYLQQQAELRARRSQQ